MTFSLSLLLLSLVPLCALSQICENDDEDSLMLLQVGVVQPVPQNAMMPKTESLSEAPPADPMPRALCSSDQVPVAKYWVDHQVQCTAGMEGHEAWSFGWASSFCAVNGSPAYEDPKMKTADGVFLYDAAWCREGGLIDPPDKQRLLSNFTALMEKSKESCSTDGVKETLATTTKEERADAENKINAMIVAEGRLPKEDRQGFVTHKLFLETHSQQCQDDFSSCMVHFCLNYFCYLPDGRIGAGCMCNKDFKLNPIPSER